MKQCIRSYGDIDTGGPEGRAILVAVHEFDDGSREVVPQRPTDPLTGQVTDPKGFVFATDQHATEIAARKQKQGW